MAAGRLTIGDVIPFTAPQYGLLSTATELNIADAHWRLGITWEPLCPESHGTYDPCITVTSDGVTEAPPPEDKSESTVWQVRGATPFTVYSQIDCSPVGMWEQLPERNRQALLRSEASTVETIFWTGIADTEAGTPQETVFPHLASDDEIFADDQSPILLQSPATQVTTTPQEIVIALGMLEDAMRDCYPGVPTIHMPIRLAAIAVDHHLIEPRNGIMRTVSTGAKVVIGDYPGTAPDGTEPPANTTWMYATGEVFYIREPQPHTFRPVESFDRNVNTLSMIAERTYVIGWDCCLLAIPVLNGEI